MIFDDDWMYDQLCQMASVKGGLPDFTGITQESTHRLLAMARVHGVLGIVLSKLNDQPGLHPETWNIAQRAWKGEVVQSMRVRQHAQKIIRAFDKANIPATIIKGPDFADHLFDDPRTRSTLDVDVMVPRTCWLAAAAILESTGHQQKRNQPGPFLPTGVLAERNWIAVGKHLEVDLHWDLVDLPFFRRQASIEYWDLDWKWLPGNRRELTPASRLLMTAIHAVYHHQFERVILLADIQRACRKVTNDAEQQAARALAERTGSVLALDLALRITSRFLNDSEVERLRKTVIGTSGGDIPEWLFDDARKTLRSIRMFFRKPERRRIREWILQQPLFSEPGWEFRPGPAQAGFTTFIPNYIGQEDMQSEVFISMPGYYLPSPRTSEG